MYAVQQILQSSEFLDSTDNGAKCDFCSWRLLTASDPGFGRIELPHAVTGSNLFKYAGAGAAAAVRLLQQAVTTTADAHSWVHTTTLHTTGMHMLLPLLAAS